MRYDTTANFFSGPDMSNPVRFDEVHVPLYQMRVMYPG